MMVYLNIEIMSADFRFELRGAVYLNNTVLMVGDIGEGENALLCFTNSSNYCSSRFRGREFYFPNNSLVRIRGSGANFYRNRGEQFIRLNRRNNATPPTGRYRCEIPDANGNTQSIFINIGKVVANVN